MQKRIQSLMALGLVAVIAASVFLSAPVHAQNRRVMLEEYTGAWCGWCVRGALAIQKLDAKYPGQVIAVAVHGPASYGEPMATAQGDSLNSGIGFPVSDQYGYPDGWTARTNEAAHGDWNVDPDSWIDTLNASGLVDQMVNQPASASVTVDQVTFDANTHMVSARVSAKFNSAMSGDLRLNLYVIEDSVIGTSDPLWVQHNYYYHNANFPTSPYYNLGDPYTYQGQADGSTIPNYVFMHVFREAVGGIWGVSGVIPASAVAGQTYSTTFHFFLPTNVNNPSHAKLVGFVHQYSKTNSSANQILDAAEVPLTTSPITIGTNNLDVSANDGQYLYAHASGDTSTSFTITNNGTGDVMANLSVLDGSLPAGWSITFNPPSVTIAGGSEQTVTATIHAPEQSNYVVPTIVVTPQINGEFVQSSMIQLGLLSDNTLYEAFSYSGEAAATNGMPDTMRLHTAYMPLSSDLLSYFDPSDPASPARLVMFLGDPTLDGGESVDGVPSAMQTILDAMYEGKEIYISSNDAMAWAFVGQAATKTEAVQGFFHDSLGITWGSNVSRISNNAYVAFTVNGTTDPIAAGMTSLSANAAGTLAGDGETPLFIVPSGSPSTSLFYVDNTKTSNVSLKAHMPNGNRVIYMGFALNSLADQTKADTIFRRSIEWLMSGSHSGTAPITANPTSLEFGNVPAGQTKSLTVQLMNTSSTTASISSASITPSSMNFSVSGAAFPLTLPSGGTATLTVTFAPLSQGDQTATLALNLPGGDYSTLVQLHGTGSAAGVDVPSLSAASFSASPNPFHGATQVSYTAAPGEKNVTLAAYDVLGRQVVALQAESSGNTYTASFDGSKLPVGTYIIMAHSSKGTQQIKVVNQE